MTDDEHEEDEEDEEDTEGSCVTRLPEASDPLSNVCLLSAELASEAERAPRGLGGGTPFFGERGFATGGGGAALLDLEDKDPLSDPCELCLKCMRGPYHHSLKEEKFLLTMWEGKKTRQ